MSKKQKSEGFAGGIKPFYFEHLPTDIIKYLAKFVVSKDTENDKDKKDLYNLITLFMICRVEYAETVRKFKIKCYLMKYAGIYYDVLLLAHQQGLNVEEKEPGYCILYTIINANDQRFLGYNHDSVIINKRSSPIVLVNDELYYEFVWSQDNIDSIDLSEDGIKLNLKRNFTKSHQYDKYLIAIDTMPLLDMKYRTLEFKENTINIPDRTAYSRQKLHIELKGNAFMLKTNLTIERFIELVNKLEHKTLIKQQIIKIEQLLFFLLIIIIHINYGY